MHFINISLPCVLLLLAALASAAPIPTPGDDYAMTDAHAVAVDSTLPAYSARDTANNLPTYAEAAGVSAQNTLPDATTLLSDEELKLLAGINPEQLRDAIEKMDALGINQATHSIKLKPAKICLCLLPPALRFEVTDVHGKCVAKMKMTGPMGSDEHVIQKIKITDPEGRPIKTKKPTSQSDIDRSPIWHQYWRSCGSWLRFQKCPSASLDTSRQENEAPETSGGQGGSDVDVDVHPAKKP